MKFKRADLSGSLYKHLGHFTQDRYVKEGHNTNEKDAMGINRSPANSDDGLDEPGERMMKDPAGSGGGGMGSARKWGETGAVGSRERGIRTADNYQAKPGKYSKADMEAAAYERGRAYKSGASKEDMDTLAALEREMIRSTKASGRKVPNTYFSEQAGKRDAMKRSKK